MDFEVTGNFPVVDPEVTDNGYLESCPMTLPGVIRSDADIQGLLSRGREIVTAHGRRHSQGGQSLCREALSVDLDRLQAVSIDDAAGTATVQAGATWDDLHQALWRHPGRRFAPTTHQSSPGFSIGGSLAVNCHGRDPRQGPLSESVLALELMMANGSPRTVRRGEAGDGGDLFRTVLGGYGACALILGATLRLKEERQVKLEDEILEASDYARWLAQDMAPGKALPPFHHAWLNCAGDKTLFTRAICIAGKDAGAPERGDPEKLRKPLDNESLINDDMLSVIYRAYRDAPASDRGRIWERFTREFVIKMTSSGSKRTLNLMRAPVRFTETRPHVPIGQADEEVDLMQEYFVPVARLGAFIEAARAILVDAQARDVLHVLSSTVRLTQADTTTLLPYAPGAARACVVINFKTRRAQAARFEDDTSPLTGVLRALVDAARAEGGSYYLCYGRFARRDQFEAAFAATGPNGSGLRERWQAVRQAVDPQHRFDNHFLRQFLG